MAKKVKAEGKVLLDELLSIRQLLDDELEGNDAPSDNIPILHDIDIELLGYDPATEPVADGKPAVKPIDAEENPLIKRANAALRRNIKNTSQLLKPLTREMLGENPFLPQKTLDRLNANKIPTTPRQTPGQATTADEENLTELFQSFLDLSPDQQARARQLLEQQGDKIVEQLIKDTLPRLETELRHRLRQQLDNLLPSTDDD